MSTSTLRIVIALFLIIHAWVHFSLTTVPLPVQGGLRTPFWPSWWRDATDPTWFASKIGLPNDVVRTLGWILWVAVVAGLSLAALGLLGLPGLASLWRVTAIFGTAASLILLAFYWHPWLVLGVVIDLVVLSSISQQWPVFLFQSK